MKKWSFVFLIFCTYSVFAGATDNLRISDSRSLSMGGNGAAHSPFFNPALLALRTQKELRLDYYNRYSLKELSTISGGFCYPNRILPAGFHVASFGYDQYRESLFRFSAGKRLNTYWALGVSVEYALLQSELFETDASRLSTDIGLSLCPEDDWLITLSVINFPSVSLGGEEVDNERIATYLLEMNVNWMIVDNVLITGGAAHCRETPFSASLGMEYLLFGDFRLRAGIRTVPFLPSLGIGCRFSAVTADVVAIYHPVLGACTGLGLSYSF
jgi:hypothetical protein